MAILDILKPIHVLAGSLTLLSGIVAMTSKKGQNVHRLSGKVFFWVHDCNYGSWPKCGNF